jgi:hypothetical protein
VWIARALVPTRRSDATDIEDAEFIDRPIRALSAREQGLTAPIFERAESSWMPLAVGLSIVALIGVMGVVVYLLVRRKEDGNTAVLGAVDPRYLPQAPPPQVYLIHTGNAQPQVVRAEPVAPSRDRDKDSALLATLERIEAGIGALVSHERVPYSQSTLRTYRLPWLADGSTPAVRIGTAGNASMEAVVRVVSPPGALAAFSFSPNELNIPQTVVAPGLSTVPAGDTLVIPAGQQQRIHMNPKQALYAKGNMSPSSPTGPVVVSISTVDNYIAR